ncbi:MAG TPA: bifunctional glutamine synthetase adenylyltransferase/deadenyltransferase, partial [Candidatus Tenderia electrophaga]|nr:bifunctional glutamine synthetase adenylyltransferase/deadenyltransferase [Candidatus Tenderia electrophaga]
MANEINNSAMTLPEAGLADLPAELRLLLQDQWQGFCAGSDELARLMLADERLALSLCRVWASSDFVAKACLRFPAMLQALVDEGHLQNECSPDYYKQHLSQLLVSASDDNQLGVVLRQFRRREMVRIAWRDIAGWTGLDETLRDLSALACACVDVSLAHLHQWQAAELGMPMGEQSGKPQSLVVLGMGKLGAGELNYSSDIDLIFAYPEEGQTQGARRHEQSNSEYFV